MGKNPTQERRAAAGLCIQCGGERTGKGITKHRCAACSAKNRDACRRYKERNPDKRTHPRDEEKRRAWYEARREERLAAGLCVRCGAPRDGRHPTARLCGACAEKDRRYGAAARTRRRHAEEGLPLPEGADRGNYAVPRPRGGALPRVGDGVYRLVVSLDRRTFERLDTRRRQEAARAAGGYAPPVSLLVRTILREWETRPGPPPAPNLLRQYKLHVRLDERAHAVLRRHALTAFGGNQSAALRAILCACVPPVFASAKRERFRDD